MLPPLEARHTHAVRHGWHGRGRPNGHQWVVRLDLLQVGIQRHAIKFGARFRPEAADLVRGRHAAGAKFGESHARLLPGQDTRRPPSRRDLGFVKVLVEKYLAIADRPGNNRGRQRWARHRART